MNKFKVGDKQEKSYFDCVQYKTCHYCGRDFLESTMSFVEVSNSHLPRYMCNQDDCEV